MTESVSCRVCPFKMKSGLSNRLLATLFRISISSVRRAVSTVRMALLRSFVPLYLCLESVTCDQIITQHTRPLAKSLSGVDDNDTILVLDGTYIYIQESKNFCFQRQSYSVHKCKPLVKPMVVVTTTGHFVTIMGPYIARNNDASLLNYMLKQNVEDIKSFLKGDDVIVIDRGFRDSVTVPEDMGIRAAMQTFMKKGEKKMSMEDARLVTKIRWVVESAYSVKRYKFLEKVLPTSQGSFIEYFVRIVCAISNKYFPALTGPTNEDEDATLASHMRELSIQVNTLQRFVEDNHLDRRTTKWTAIEESDLENFPLLSSSFIQEYFEGDSVIHVHKD